MSGLPSPPDGRRPTRYERIARGLPVCANDNGCPRAPMGGNDSGTIRPHGLCRVCRSGGKPHNGRLGPDVRSRLLELPAALNDRLVRRAEAEGVSASEVIRRALAKALETP